MRTPLFAIEVPSIYFVGGIRTLLPNRMAICTPDTGKAIQELQREVAAHGGALYISDLYRSYDMQLQSHLDWKAKKKKAFSPPPGGSMHEAGRALDLDLKALRLPLAEFWAIAAVFGFFPVITAADAKISEAWHFDRRGSHHRVYEYYAAKKGQNMAPYAAMAASAILATGVRVDRFGERQREAAIQSGLIRLGHELGSIDGEIGAKTCAALDAAGLRMGDVDATLLAVEHALQEKFPEEYEQPASPNDGAAPAHVIS